MSNTSYLKLFYDPIGKLLIELQASHMDTVSIDRGEDEGKVGGHWDIALLGMLLAKGIHGRKDGKMTTVASNINLNSIPRPKRQNRSKSNNNPLDFSGIQYRIQKKSLD